MRIVSLLPSATEIVFALGRGDDVVGVTFECDFPEEARGRRIVSTSALPEGLTPAEIDRVVSERIAAGEDLYRLDEDALGDLQPDVILTQDLCAVCAVDVTRVDDALDYLGCRAEVVTLDPRSLDEVIKSIGTVASVIDAEPKGARLIDETRQRLARLTDRLRNAPSRSTLMLEWTDPPFSAGHWIPDLVSFGGGTPVLAHPGGDSQRLPFDALQTAAAEFVIVAPCGYHLERSTEIARAALAQHQFPAGAEVWAVDADAYFVRPGPRVVTGAEIVAGILHPSIVGAPSGAHATRVA